MEVRSLGLALRSVCVVILLSVIGTVGTSPSVSSAPARGSTGVLISRQDLVRVVPDAAPAALGARNQVRDLVLPQPDRRSSWERLTFLGVSAFVVGLVVWIVGALLRWRSGRARPIEGFLTILFGIVSIVGGLGWWGEYGVGHSFDTRTEGLMWAIVRGLPLIVLGTRLRRAPLPRGQPADVPAKGAVGARSWGGLRMAGALIYLLVVLNLLIVGVDGDSEWWGHLALLGQLGFVVGIFVWIVGAILRWRSGRSRPVAAACSIMCGIMSIFGGLTLLGRTEVVSFGLSRSLTPWGLWGIVCGTSLALLGTYLMKEPAARDRPRGDQEAR